MAKQLEKTRPQTNPRKQRAHKATQMSIHVVMCTCSLKFICYLLSYI